MGDDEGSIARGRLARTVNESTSDLSDANGEHARVLPPVLRHFGGRRRFSGEVVTVRCLEDNSLLRKLVTTEGSGRVIVVDGGGSTRCALLGDILAAEALAHGWAGVVIWGGVRDTAALAELDVGVVALAPTPRRSRKNGEGQLGVPVEIAGIPCAPGDTLVADETASSCSPDVAGRVVRISYAPVKALALLHPGSIELGAGGLRPNRRFHLVDDEGRLLNGKRCGELVAVAAAAADDDSTLELRFPDGALVGGEVVLGASVVTDFFGTPTPGRIVEGPWSAALSAFAGRALRLVRVEGAEGGCDRGRRGTVSLVSTASLAHLAEQAGESAIDDRRFRMLFTIDGVDAYEEDTWVGREIAVGDAVVRVNGLAGRCVVTTHDPQTGRPTLDTLRVLRAYRGQVPSDEPLPFGVWGEVLRPGAVALGSPVGPT